MVVVDPEAPRGPSGRPSTDAVASAVLRRTVRPLLLVALGFGGGSATTAGIASRSRPPAVELDRDVEVEQRYDLDACRLAVDYSRRTALACGVEETELEALARERLGPPPPLSRDK
jgi:hypothetical protein